jgi:hypothetical protein
MSATGDLIDGMEEEIIKLRKQREAYQIAVNRIDDFFEYANESKKDRKFIHGVLDTLTKTLSNIE